MAYGDKRDYPKINIYLNGVYQWSTTWSRTCREALEHTPQQLWDDNPDAKITARFDKPRKRSK